MSIYTYKTHKTLCEVFNTEYYEDPSVSDQALDVLPKDVLITGTDYVSGLIWITNGEKDTYIDPKEQIPEGWWKGRSASHMSKTNPTVWVEICRKSAKNQWKNNTTRKKRASKKMKTSWKTNYNAMAENARKNGKHGMFGKLSARALLLEYKGVEYYGWRELKEATNVTKDLYKKYYLNGIDPEPRIGKNGPAPSTSTTDKVRQGGSS